MRSLTLLYPQPNPGRAMAHGDTFGMVGSETWPTGGSNADFTASSLLAECDRGNVNASMALKPDYGRSSDLPNPSMICLPLRSGQAPRTDPSSALGA
jgi:hypothetical protein